MLTTIYIDSIFLMNLILDISLLMLTVKTLKKTATFLRLFTAGLVGSFGYCLTVCLPGGFYLTKTACIMVPSVFLMVKAGCKTKGVRELLYATGYLYTYAFLLGGATLFLTKRIPFFVSHKENVLWVTVIGTLVCLLCARAIAGYRKKAENHFCRVRLKGGTICVSGLLDTGNGLTEPISGKPVAILESEIWQQMEEEKRPEKLRVIPFHSIGKENGILEGYEVDKIEIEYNADKRELNKVMIAVFQGKLSSKGEYQMILPTQFTI